MLKHVNSDGEFAVLLQQSTGLLVVDYFATWCGPCQQVAPFFEQLSGKYQNVTFGKVDVDKCPSIAASQGVSAMPTFIFYVNKVKVDKVSGANGAELEEKVKKWAESAGQGADAIPNEVPGQSDLACFISTNECECLNESNLHNFEKLIQSKGDENVFLESDCDEQLIINIQFNQPIKLHSIKLKGPGNYAPKTVKLFINAPVTHGFDDISRAIPVQTLLLTEKQATDGEIVNLTFVKYQNVRNVTLFIADNQGSMDTTRINRLQLYGSPINATKMQEFKRVSGKAGEAH